MVLKTSGLRKRLLAAVFAQWGVLKRDERVLRSQYNLSQVQLDRYLKDYTAPTNVQLSSWEDKVAYYKMSGVREVSSDLDTPGEEYHGFQDEEMDVEPVRRRTSWLKRLQTSHGDTKWIVQQLRWRKSKPMRGKCQDLLADLCIEMNVFKCGFRYNREELTSEQLNECRRTIVVCEIMKQEVFTEGDWEKLDAIDKLLSGDVVQESIDTSGETPVDHLLRLVQLLKVEGDSKAAMAYLEAHSVNIKMMNVMIPIDPKQVLELMFENNLQANFETFIQLLKVSNKQETVDLIEYIMKNKIICRTLWVEMMKAGVRTENIKLVESMFLFNEGQKLATAEEQQVTSIAEYEIYDQLALRYGITGIDCIKLDKEICSIVYEMYNGLNDGEGMMRVVNEWEKLA